MFFAENLKYLRTRKRISQSELASDLGITRTTLAGYEKKVQPPFKVLIRMAEYFHISIDALVRYNLSQLNKFQLSQIDKGYEVDITGSQMRLLAVSVNESGDENIELVPVKAQAGYTSSFGDLDFIASLPKFSLPFLPKEQTYRCFQIEGDSMLPIPEGSWVTCSYIDDWTQLKNGTPCIVVMRDEGLVFKIVYNKIEQERTLQLVSSNRIYKPYEIDINSVAEIWKFETFNGFTIDV